MAVVLNRLFTLFISAVVAISSFSFSSLFTTVVRTDRDDYIGLKTAYADYFRIGAAVSAQSLFDNKEMVLKNFNSITCENAMKLYAIHPAEDVWDFTEADKIADFCRENGLVMRGHCLVWGFCFDVCPWMLYNSDGNYASKELFFARLKDHIKTVIKRYDDVVYCWDVINEALNYDDSAEFKDYLVYRLYGEDYIKNAFRFAAEVLNNLGSDAKLFLNETKIERNTTKWEYTYDFIKEMKAEGIRVDGIGIQGHYDFYHPSESACRVDKAIKQFAALGLDVEITEMDITIYGNIIPDVKYTTLPEWREAVQRERYAKLFKVFRDNADVITNVTFWGVNDGVSYCGISENRTDWPLLFDKDSNPKSNYYAVTDFYFTKPLIS